MPDRHDIPAAVIAFIGLLCAYLLWLSTQKQDPR